MDADISTKRYLADFLNLGECLVDRKEINKLMGYIVQLEGMLDELPKAKQALETRDAIISNAERAMRRHEKKNEKLKFDLQEAQRSGSLIESRLEDEIVRLRKELVDSNIKFTELGAYYIHQSNVNVY